MSRKNKFDLTALVHHGALREGETLCFVSDPSKTATITRQPNGEYKLKSSGETLTVHAAAQKFLGQEPPDHASRWLRTQSGPNGRTLYELWQQDLDEAKAA